MTLKDNQLSFKSYYLPMKFKYLDYIIILLYLTETASRNVQNLSRVKKMIQIGFYILCNSSRY